MKTVKARCYIYDIKEHKGRWVEKEIVIFPEPKPKPSPEEIRLKKICETILQLDTAIQEIAKKVNVTVKIDSTAAREYINQFNSKYLK